MATQGDITPPTSGGGGGLLGEWKNASSKEKILIVGAIATVILVALYLFSKQSSSSPDTINRGTATSPGLTPENGTASSPAPTPPGVNPPPGTMPPVKPPKKKHHHHPEKEDRDSDRDDKRKRKHHTNTPQMVARISTPVHFTAVANTAARSNDRRKTKVKRVIPPGWGHIHTMPPNVLPK